MTKNAKIHEFLLINRKLKTCELTIRNYGHDCRRFNSHRRCDATALICLQTVQTVKPWFHVKIKLDPSRRRRSTILK